MLLKQRRWASKEMVTLIDFKPLKKFMNNNALDGPLNKIVNNEPDSISATDFPAIAKMILDIFDEQRGKN